MKTLAQHIMDDVARMRAARFAVGDVVIVTRDSVYCGRVGRIVELGAQGVSAAVLLDGDDIPRVFRYPDLALEWK